MSSLLWPIQSVRQQTSTKPPILSSSKSRWSFGTGKPGARDDQLIQMKKAASERVGSVPHEIWDVSRYFGALRGDYQPHQPLFPRRLSQPGQGIEVPRWPCRAHDQLPQGHLGGSSGLRASSCRVAAQHPHELLPGRCGSELRRAVRRRRTHLDCRLSIKRLRAPDRTPAGSTPGSCPDC
jgi:hypothetical protein